MRGPGRRVAEPLELPGALDQMIEAAEALLAEEAALEGVVEMLDRAIAPPFPWRDEHGRDLLVQTDPDDLSEAGRADERPAVVEPQAPGRGSPWTHVECPSVAGCSHPRARICSIVRVTGTGPPSFSSSHAIASAPICAHGFSASRSRIASTCAFSCSLVRFATRLGVLERASAHPGSSGSQRPAHLATTGGYAPYPWRSPRATPPTAAAAPPAGAALPPHPT